jgi:hypothetical protein
MMVSTTLVVGGAGNIVAGIRGLSQSMMSVSYSNSWRRVIEAKLIWGWLLTNHQGYTDGAQLEFRGESSGDTSCVQVLVIASTLEVRTVLLP